MEFHLIILVYMGGSKKLHNGARGVCEWGGGGGRVPKMFFFLSHQLISRTSLRKQLDQRGPIASQGEAVPVFLRKPIAICDSCPPLDRHARIQKSLSEGVQLFFS